MYHWHFERELDEFKVLQHKYFPSNDQQKKNTSPFHT